MIPYLPVVPAAGRQPHDIGMIPYLPASGRHYRGYSSSSGTSCGFSVLLARFGAVNGVGVGTPCGLLP